MKNKRRLLVSVLAGFMAFLMVLTLALSVLPVRASAKSSSEIRQELKDLQNQAAKIKEEQEALQEKIDANMSETKDIVQQKDEIDDQIKLLYDQIDNTNAQIQNYNLLIAEKQEELDDALERQEELNEEYRIRLRAMEENGKVSYWSILFKSNSFLDLLDQINMIGEIAERDQRMLEEIDAVAKEISEAQAELEADKTELEMAKDELEASQITLDEKRAEADDILKKLNEDAVAMQAMHDEMASKEEEISKDIAQKEKEYNDKKKEEEAAKPKPPSGNGGNSGNSGGNTGNSGGGGGFSWPVRGKITSAYGWREDPVTHKKAYHSGIDIGASKGTAIGAAKGGVVTTASKSPIWGYYVVINHGDGYSTLYAHMTHYTVKVGQEVNKGQTIGYVGSTGKSTGPHLHLTVYYNGSTVNPVSVL